MAVDSNSADAYILLAVLRGLGQWNWKEAEQAAKRATELNPGNSEAWDTYRAMYLEPVGRLEEAVAAQKRAVSLDPRNSLLALRLANLYRELGQCDEAIRQARLNAACQPRGMEQGDQCGGAQPEVTGPPSGSERSMTRSNFSRPSGRWLTMTTD